MAAFNNGLQIDRLVDGEVAGPKTVNPVIKWIRNFNVLSDFLNISVNGLGSVDLDFDFPQCAAKILAMIQDMEAEFKAEIENGNRLKVAGGHIYFPYTDRSVGSHSRSLNDISDNGAITYVSLTLDNTSWGHGSIDRINSGNTAARLPVCVTYKDAGVWHVRQMRLGSFVFNFPPHFLIGGYVENEPQILMHSANETGFSWVSAGDCNAQNNGGE